MDSLKIAIKTEEKEFKTLGIFLDTVFSAKEIYNEPGIKVIQHASQNLLEIHGPGAYSTPFLFSETNIVISLEVENLLNALKTAASLGYTVIEELNKQQAIFSFAYVKIREGFILGLYQNIR